MAVYAVAVRGAGQSGNVLIKLRYAEKRFISSSYKPRLYKEQEQTEAKIKQPSYK
jgi:hypothetical protein